MHIRLAFCLVLALASPARAQQSPDFPKGGSFVIQLTSSQFVSGFGDYLVPPLLDGFLDAGMTYDGGPARISPRRSIRIRMSANGSNRTTNRSGSTGVR